MKRPLLLCFLSVLSLGCFAKPNPINPVTVVAPAGTIIGQTGRLNSSVHEFLGIPYAEPPTGNLRFEPPVCKKPSHKPIPAHEFGLSCPSFLFLGGLYNYSVPEGEDCLSLNVWTRPRLKMAPVLVWFHGGGFTFGTSNMALYDGTYFTAHEDVVMVTVNYRTNVFGFPNSPGVSRENLGLLDQRMAVEWVRDNIAAFGGNPNKISIFGQSAGGISVDIWSYAYPHDPIVNGFIEQTGTTTLERYIDGGDRYDAWNYLTAITGCAKGNAKEQLACVKKLDWKIIKSALPKVYEQIARCTSRVLGITTGFFTTRVDGKIVFSPDEYERKRNAGKFAKLPLLIGSNDKEIPSVPLNSTTISPDCPANSSSSTGINPDPPGVTMTPELLAQLVSDIAATCPARKEARFRAKHNVPVWRYRYFGSLNFTRDDLNIYGGTHGAELLLIFGLAAELVPNLPPREAKVLREIQGAWATFAKDPAHGLSRSPFHWNKYTPDKGAKSLVRLAYGKEAKASMGTNYPYDDWCDKLGI